MKKIESFPVHLCLTPSALTPWIVGILAWCFHCFIVLWQPLANESDPLTKLFRALAHDSWVCYQPRFETQWGCWCWNVTLGICPQAWVKPSALIVRSLRADWWSLSMFLAWWEWQFTRTGCLVPLRKGGVWQPSRPASFSLINRSNPLAELVRALALDLECAIKPGLKPSGFVGTGTLQLHKWLISQKTPTGESKVTFRSRFVEHADWWKHMTCLKHVTAIEVDQHNFLDRVYTLYLLFRNLRSSLFVHNVVARMESRCMIKAKHVIGRTVPLPKPPQSPHCYLGAVDHATHTPHCSQKPFDLARCVTEIKFAQNLRWLGNWH